MTDDLKSQIQGAIDGLEGWTTLPRCLEMADLILETKPSICVELGVFGGRSLIPQALALRSNGAGVIYGIDPWKKEAALEGENEANQKWWSENVDLGKIHQGAMESVWRLGLDRWAVVIRSSSQHAASLFPRIDLLNIDGNHSEEASCRDVVNYLPSVVSGGHIWMDDTDWDSTRKAIGLLDGQCVIIKDSGHYRLYRKR